MGTSSSLPALLHTMLPCRYCVCFGELPEDKAEDFLNTCAS